MYRLKITISVFTFIELQFRGYLVRYCPEVSKPKTHITPGDVYKIAIGNSYSMHHESITDSFYLSNNIVVLFYVVNNVAFLKQ